ncbi:MAG: radical SAM protein [Mariprofundales bacterium]
MSLFINEIYDCIQGESSLAGLGCTLIRLAGCPLRCTYCDTPQSWPFNKGQQMTIAAIIAHVRQHNRPLVLITGGEPLAQKQTLDLLQALLSLTPLTNTKAMKPIIQLETSGLYPISPVPMGIKRILDIKTPASGMLKHNHWENLKSLRIDDEIKFVLNDKSDYDWAKEIIEQYKLFEFLPAANILFSPVWGNLELAHLAEWVLVDNLNVRVHTQLHRHIWGDTEQQI